MQQQVRGMKREEGGRGPALPADLLDLCQPSDARLARLLQTANHRKRGHDRASLGQVAEARLALRPRRFVDESDERRAQREYASGRDGRAHFGWCDISASMMITWLPRARPNPCTYAVPNPSLPAASGARACREERVRERSERRRTWAGSEHDYVLAVDALQLLRHLGADAGVEW